MAIKKKKKTVRSTKTRKPATRKSKKSKNWFALDFANHWKTIIGVFGAAAGLAVFFSNVGPVDHEPIEIVHESEVVKPTTSNPFEQAEAMPIGERVEFWSKHLSALIKKGKTLDAMAGAPTIQDKAPLIPNQFDCTTFVETVGALAKSQRAKDFYRNILSIRYKNSEGTYFTRNHFPEADWIPNNIQAGNLKDITAEVASKAGVAVMTQAKSIHKAEWFAKQMKSGSVDRSVASVVDTSWQKPVEAKIQYIAKDKVEKALPHFYNGMVVNLVRANNPRFEVMVSHQGVIVKNGEKVLFRHASTDGSVRTQPFAEYILSQKYKGWPIIGINLNQWNEGWN